MNAQKLFSALVLLVILSACNRNSIIGRKQFTLFSESSLQQLAFTEYENFLKKNKVLSPETNVDAAMVKRVGQSIAAGITLYFTSKGKGIALDGYQWEFKLVQSDEVNAWCMPGGKVVVYTGLLKITQNEEALAIVMGHEITHALARHGNERMSQAAVAQGLQVAGNILTQNNTRANDIFRAVYTPTATIGILLPNSRSQESEADRFGLIFSAMAGYNPMEAVAFWNRMDAASKTNVPEFLATHPSNSKRIEQCKIYAEEAMTYYKKSK